MEIETTINLFIHYYFYYYDDKTTSTLTKNTYEMKKYYYNVSYYKIKSQTNVYQDHAI